MTTRKAHDVAKHGLFVYREKHGLSQMEMAARAKVSQSIISRIERGRGAGRKGAQLVWEAINGEIPLRELLGIPELRKRRRPRKRAN